MKFTILTFIARLMRKRAKPTAPLSKAGDNRGAVPKPAPQIGHSSDEVSTFVMPEGTPADTAEAIRAEVARVMALPRPEQALVGSKYTDPEELWRALEAGGGDGTLMLRGSWMKKQNVAGGFRLPKRGEPLPPEAIIKVAELRQISKNSMCTHGALPVVALSHFWRTKEDPDPDGETAELVLSALNERWREFEAQGVTDVAIIIDWCALYQAPRTEAQTVIFLSGLKGINQWYAHQGTTVWLITEGADRVKGLTYWDKGWCSFEFALAMLIKPANTSDLKDWAQVDLGKKGDSSDHLTAQRRSRFRAHKWAEDVHKRRRSRQDCGTEVSRDHV